MKASDCSNFICLSNKDDFCTEFTGEKCVKDCFNFGSCPSCEKQEKEFPNCCNDEEFPNFCNDN